MFELVTLGEVLLRLSVKSPDRFETTRSLDVQIGGAEANVAAACARLGLNTALISALPDNVWGERVRRELRSHGVDTRHIVSSSGGRLGVYFLEYAVSPRPIQVVYDRADSAFSRLSPDDVDWAPVRQARLVHVSGVTAALGANGRALVRRLLDEAAVVSFDVNYRSTLWTPDEAREFISPLLPRVRYLFLGDSEAQTVFALAGSAEASLEAISRVAPKATITLLQGRRGSTMLDAGRILRPSVMPSADVIDPIGAGDAYVAGYLWAILRDRPPQEAMNIAAVVGALKCSTWGDVALISVREVEEALSGNSDIRR
jgi:2-dehydro-3-deoxygluconokinase